MSLQKTIWSDCGGFNCRPEKLNNMVTCWIAGFRCQLFFPGAAEHDHEFSEIEKITDAAELRDALNWMSIELGVLASVPRRTAQQIIENSVKESRHKTAQDLSDFRKHQAKQILYLREPASHEKHAKYVYAFDKNAMFLSAMNIALGVGNFEVIEDCYFSAKDKNKVGLYQVELALPPVDKIQNNLPFEILFRSKNNQAREYLYTPELALALDSKTIIKAKRAWIFKDSARTLEKFYSIVSGAIKKAKHENNKPCEKSLKSMYTRFIGWLGHNGEYNDFYRPDWRSLIIAEANARLIRNLQTAQKANGLSPVAIRYDEVYYFSSEENPEKVLPHPFTGSAAQYKFTKKIPSEIFIEQVKSGKGIAEIADGWKAGQNGN